MEALQVRTIDCLIALISKRNIDRILMQTCQHKCIQLLTALFIRGNQDLCNRIINFCLILLCRKISINRSAHRRQGGLRVIRSSPADIKYHIEISSLHAITVRLLFLSMDVQGDTQLLVFALEIFRNCFFRHTVTVIKQLQFHFLAVFFTYAVSSQRPACFLQHLRCFFHIILIWGQIDIAVRNGRCKQCICRLFQTIENTL